MNIKKLFTSSPNKSIEDIIEFTKNNSFSYHKLFDFEMQKFGTFTLKELISEYQFKKIKHEDIDIEPLNIIATSHHPNFCNTPIIQFYLDKEKRYKYENHFSKEQDFDYNYFFSNINRTDPFEVIKYYIVNDRYGNKKYIIRHGHHRSITAYFLQILDNNYRLKGAEAIEYKINWDLVNTKKYFNLFNRGEYFDYKKFEAYFI
ncbi:hypothetical protein CRV00_05650 [Malaciobacter molluscorum]|uniref:hypothetical protein n=1 Tax=Malaciobacter molluscorum TaxID=1032072 RepID=UPI00100BF9B6|nr:hypothetical protein [Malaciobacter molluscorum]RXJ94816.1 hypothetical protein CRV00_05650 [Malaciobacter molluscorum]